MISLNRVTVQIGKKIICREFNLEIAAGSTWGILGPNGSGKTTFLQALAGLHPVKGEIKIQDKNIHRYSRKILAQSLGLLLQHFHASFPQTVLDYCLGGRYPHLDYLKRITDLDRQITMQALEKMMLLDLKNRTIQSLSGGEKRRLAIASLLVQQPHCYLLDEPTNHLDIHYQFQVLHHFNQLAKQKTNTIIMSLHDINLAQQFCDYVLLLFPNGDVLAGETLDLLSEKTVSNLYQHQLRRLCIDDRVYWVAN